MTTYSMVWPVRLTRSIRDAAPVSAWPARAAPWLVLAVSVSLYAALGLHLHQPFHVGRRALNAFDLTVYRGAAERVVHGIGLYATPIHRGFGFTYPPFTALLFTPLTLASLSFDAIAVTAVNLALLVWVLRRALLMPMGRSLTSGARDRAGAWRLALCAAAVALWLEPVSVTLGYGQVNLLIAALVVGDLSRPDDARGKGIGIGLAAALKLTPLIFVPYLLLTGRRRAAAWAATTSMASVVTAYVVLPGDAARFWGGRLFLDPSRVGGAADTADQSLRGAIARLDPAAHPTLGSYLVIASVALLGMILAARAGRRGDEAAGFSLVALTALLVSPISWTHHWALAVPALLLLACRAYERRSLRLGLGAVALTCAGFAYIPEWSWAADPHDLGSWLISNPYVVIACAVLVGLAASEVSRAAHSRRRRPEPDRAGRRVPAAQPEVETAGPKAAKNASFAGLGDDPGGRLVADATRPDA